MLKIGFSNCTDSDRPTLMGLDLITEAEDWSKRYGRKVGCKLELIDPFTGKLVPKPSIRTFTFKPEVKTIFKIKPEKKKRSKTVHLNSSTEDFGNYI